MELVFDVVGIHQYEPGLISNKSFTETGGVIGRAGHCDWIIPDSKRIILANMHESAIRTAHFSSPTSAATAFG